MLYNFGEVAPRAQQFHLRRLNGATAGLALPLLEAQYREHDIDMGGQRLVHAIRELVRGHHGILLLAGRAGVAAVSFEYSLERGGRIAWLEELYVAPASRGRGIGTLLLDRAVKEARRAGCVSVELEVVRGHERAARLYRRHGFSALPRRRYSLPLH
jgi:GNAT superfamily N-acetyltransferase